MYVNEFAGGHQTATSGGRQRYISLKVQRLRNRMSHRHLFQGLRWSFTIEAKKLGVDLGNRESM